MRRELEGKELEGDVCKWKDAADNHARCGHFCCDGLIHDGHIGSTKSYYASYEADCQMAIGIVT